MTLGEEEDPVKGLYREGLDLTWLAKKDRGRSKERRGNPVNRENMEREEGEEKPGNKIE